MKSRIGILFIGAASFIAGPMKAENVSLGKIMKERLEIERLNQRRAAELERQAEADTLLAGIRVDSLTSETYKSVFKPILGPKVYSGYYSTQSAPRFMNPENFEIPLGTIAAGDSTFTVEYPVALPSALQNPIPDWLRKSLRTRRAERTLEYRYMVSHPLSIDYAAWDLPEPPELPEEDMSFHGYLSRLNLPEIDTGEIILNEIERKRKNWLHTFNVALQFSQAFVSTNWYQGGNDYLAFLFNIGWAVELNTVYHPNLLFQSDFQYKLAFNTTPKGSLHKFSTSQDLLQYNLKTGLKAVKNWFYSFTLLFQTQIFPNYPDESLQRSSAFLSPGTLNLGLGMTYNWTKPEIFTISASISPLAYNLKTCIFNDIDHAQFNIEPGHKTVSEIGSSGEINMTWNIRKNISWKSRLFLFTDYKYFLADWENTFNFQISRVLSTQLFLHPRLDTSSEWNRKWKHFMFREILSFGISYTFTDKV